MIQNLFDYNEYFFLSVQKKLSTSSGLRTFLENCVSPRCPFCPTRPIGTARNSGRCCSPMSLHGACSVPHSCNPSGTTHTYMLALCTRTRVQRRYTRRVQYAGMKYRAREPLASTFGYSRRFEYGEHTSRYKSRACIDSIVHARFLRSRPVKAVYTDGRGRGMCTHIYLRALMDPRAPGCAGLKCNMRGRYTVVYADGTREFVETVLFFFKQTWNKKTVENGKF